MFRPTLHVSLLVRLDRYRRPLLRSDGPATVDTNRLPSLFPHRRTPFLVGQNPTLREEYRVRDFAGAT